MASNMGELEMLAFESAKEAFKPSSLVEHGDVPGLTEALIPPSAVSDGANYS